MREEKKLPPGMAGRKRKGLAPRRQEIREQREDRGQHDEDERFEGRKGSVPEWRYGSEKGLPLRMKREYRREKREERDNTINMRGSKEAMIRPQNGGMVQNRFGP